MSNVFSAVRVHACETEYASVVRARSIGARGPAVWLAAFAVLFAPATEEGPAGSIANSRDLIGARILAPTIREAVVATDPELSTHDPRMGERLSGPRSVPLALASIAIVVLLMWVSLAAGLPSGGGPRLIAFLSPAPRGPPRLRSV